MPKRRTPIPTNPMGMWFDMTAMAMDAGFVIPMRLAKIAAGGTAATREASGMITEKIMAANHAAITLATGGKPEAVVRHYRGKVGANRRRLSK